MKLSLKTLAALGISIVIGCSSNGNDGGGQPGTAQPPGPIVPGDMPPAAQEPDPSKEPDPGPCTTAFTFTPPNGTAPSSVAVAGEFNTWSLTATAMTKAADGSWSASAQIPPGLVAYKLVVDNQWQLDPSAWLRKYVGDTENSAVRVVDCKIPTLSMGTKAITRPSAGQGNADFVVKFNRRQHQPLVDVASVTATLRNETTNTPIKADVDTVNGTIHVAAGSLADGKYTITVQAADRGGAKAKPLRLVFWVEEESFEWKDALIYMAMIDRFKNGDTSNDAPPQAGVDDRAQYKGGDLQGVKQAVAAGMLDRLGARAIWLTPFNTNPSDPYIASDGVHMSMGYHGYWPVKAREVDPRIGGDAALKDFVATAHAHGIRVLMDFVVNHVHKEHEYYKAHPEWFRTGCICGTNNCDWTTHRLDCMFADYMPDVNWTSTELNEQYQDDAVWWLDTYDLDGFRIDAVKHVEDAAITNLSNRIRTEFEASGNKVFLTGETAMGWSDCGLACNADQYGTIARYIGPFGLDGQFDFVLYHAVAYNTFAYSDKGMIHADYWAQASQTQYPAGALMTPYVGSQDTARFVTLSSYRGQNASYDRGVANDQWDNPAGPPPDVESYQRQRLSLLWELGLPGVPMMYYGDEYGEWGGGDPNNRAMWRGDSATLSSDEQSTLGMIEKAGTARKNLVALRRGDYKPVFSTEPSLVYARVMPTGETALVALTSNAAGDTLNVTLPTDVPLAPGTVLKDRMGGPDVTVGASRTLTITLGSRTAAILAP
ncbi:MAG TPA: alpha-amylase family glycosyl hydrolase [Labilithrix sp.]